MSTIWNNASTVMYNGSPVNSVIYNGSVVWPASNVYNTFTLRGSNLSANTATVQGWTALLKGNPTLEWLNTAKSAATFKWPTSYTNLDNAFRDIEPWSHSAGSYLYMDLDLPTVTSMVGFMSGRTDSFGDTYGHWLLFRPSRITINAPKMIDMASAFRNFGAYNGGNARPSGPLRVTATTSLTYLNQAFANIGSSMSSFQLSGTPSPSCYWNSAFLGDFSMKKFMGQSAFKSAVSALSSLSNSTTKTKSVFYQCIGLQGITLYSGMAAYSSWCTI